MSEPMMREFLTQKVNKLITSPPATFSVTPNVVGTKRTWVKTTNVEGTLVSMDFDDPKDARLVTLLTWAAKHGKMPQKPKDAYVDLKLENDNY